MEEAAGGLVGEVREEGEVRQRSRFNLTIFQEEEEQLSPSSHRSQPYLAKTPLCLTDCYLLVTSVADPDPDVFGPPGSISRRYGSGSVSFYHQAKIVRKTLIPTVL